MNKLFNAVFVVVFGLVLSIISFGIYSNASGNLHDMAEKYAQEYISKMGDEHASVTCNRYDSDGNGYITCTVFPHHAEPQEIECGYGGCRKRLNVVIPYGRR